MDKLLEKLKEYLHMETEIPFEEFSEYYRNLIEELNKTFNELDKENRIKALYICKIDDSPPFIHNLKLLVEKSKIKLGVW